MMMGGELIKCQVVKKLIAILICKFNNKHSKHELVGVTRIRIVFLYFLFAKETKSGDQNPLIKNGVKQKFNFL